jgi:hypothetical protein
MKEQGPATAKTIPTGFGATLPQKKKQETPLIEVRGIEI